MEHGFGSFAFIIMQESLSHTQRIVLIIIRSYTDLPDKLLLGGRKKLQEVIRTSRKRFNSLYTRRVQ